MSHIIWLAFERLPHPDAVCYPADEDDARLVLELLDHPYLKRAHLAQQFRNYLAQQNNLSPFDQKSVPCRRNSGLYHPVPWRLAKWLSHVLAAPDTVVSSTRTRINTWLSNLDQQIVINPKNSAQPTL